MGIDTKGLLFRAHKEVEVAVFVDNGGVGWGEQHSSGGRSWILDIARGFILDTAWSLILDFLCS